jgi:hypothetical protein
MSGRSTTLALFVVPLMFGSSQGADTEQQAGLKSSQPSCSPAPRSSLNVTFHRQEGDYWCWAASAQMVMEYLGKKVSQCEQANKQLSNVTHDDCCNNPTPEKCDRTGWPQFYDYGFVFKKTNTPVHPTDHLSWEEVKVQLAPRDPNNPCSFTPFAFSWRVFGGTGHMMVAYGYYIDPACPFSSYHGDIADYLFVQRSDIVSVKLSNFLVTELDRDLSRCCPRYFVGI